MHNTIFYHLPMTYCVASPQAAITEHEICRFHRTHEKVQTQKKEHSCCLANPHLCTEHDIHGMEYSHWLSWAICLAVLPPSSCTPGHFSLLLSFPTSHKNRQSQKDIQEVNSTAVRELSFTRHSKENIKY